MFPVETEVREKDQFRQREYPTKKLQVRKEHDVFEDLNEGYCGRTRWVKRRGQDHVGDIDQESKLMGFCT